MGLWIISGIFTMLGMFLSSRLQSKFAQYSRMAMSNNMSGAEVAKKMLQENGISDVQVTSVQGHLTDHYNPANKTVNLSENVYNARTVAAAAVAAHECGHAVQHAHSYSMLQMRSALVPAVNFANTMQPFVLMFGLSAAYSTGNILIAYIVLSVFAVTALFSLITLPVEFDASRRALAWLDQSGFAKGEQYAGAKDALTWAAMTYVSAALAALVQLLYLAYQLLGRRRGEEN